MGGCLQGVPSASCAQFRLHWQTPKTPGQRALAKSTSVLHDSSEAKEALLSLWQELLSQPRQCTTHVLPHPSANFGLLLGSYDDLHAREYTKTICAQGAVCLARVEWKSTNYTGLFRRADYCLLRCSSALPSKLDRPGCPILQHAPGSLGRSVVMPFIALKVFSAGKGSGNLLFGGRKTGQEEQNFFAHCACTHFTERCNLAMWPVLRMFRKFSDYPTQSGLSDFASAAQDGTMESQPRFPWALVLRPVEGVCGKEDGRNFLDQLDGIRPGTALYNIMACDSPADAAEGRMEHVGQLVTTSNFIQSDLESRLRFRHQLKEDDYKIRPDWKAQLTNEHKNYGWEHFGRFQENAGGLPMPCTSWIWQDSNDGKPKAALRKRNVICPHLADSKDQCPFLSGAHKPKKRSERCKRCRQCVVS